MKDRQVCLRLVLVQKRTRLEFLKARDRALIYMGSTKQRQREALQVQRDLSHLSYTKGNGDWEALGVKVSMNGSAVQESGMSHVSYSKPKEGRKS